MDPTDSTPAPLGGIEVTTAHGRTVVRLRGEVDGALRAEASASMAQALASTAPILVDATDLTFIDSSGLAFVLQLHLAAGETGQQMTLHDPGRELIDKLDLIGMADVIPLEPERAIA
ncbi:anti-sigma factor antagonist [Cellulomonas triticagri]|uniref:Anti-sigma factor antagonist n=2 Tax=Cellulomonas triticagri TaxID=2483352 RepID=A0A3M2JWJ2_9CELL|nr:anti-sigma factor antagonist [Cellulomonas triticagri]